jgi:hypothetical protein
VYFTADELMTTTFPEPRWAVPGLVAEGLTLLVGSPKLGKSWLCLGLSIAVASGGCALGRIPVEQGDVLYAALEDTARRLQGRLHAVLDGEPVPTGLHVTIALPRGGEMVSMVDEWLTEHPNARLVIIDVLRKVTPRSDGRDRYEADLDAMSALKNLADQHAVAILVVHHTRKMTDDSDVFNEVNGSTGLTGGADAILIAKRARNTSEAVLHVTGRDITEQDYGLSWHADTCTWSLLEEPVAVAFLRDTRRKILDYVTEHPLSTPTQIAEGTGLAPGTVKVNVRRMVEDDQLDSDGQGRYLPGRGVTEAVTESLPTLDEGVTPVTGVTLQVTGPSEPDEGVTGPVTQAARLQRLHGLQGGDGQGLSS